MLKTTEILNPHNALSGNWIEITFTLLLSTWSHICNVAPLVLAELYEGHILSKCWFLLNNPFCSLSALPHPGPAELWPGCFFLVVELQWWRKGWCSCSAGGWVTTTDLREVSKMQSLLEWEKWCPRATQLLLPDLCENVCWILEYLGWKHWQLFYTLLLHNSPHWWLRKLKLSPHYRASWVKLKF